MAVSPWARREIAEANGHTALAERLRAVVAGGHVALARARALKDKAEVGGLESVRARPGRVGALGVFRGQCTLHGAFVWAQGAYQPNAAVSGPGRMCSGGWHRRRWCRRERHK